MVLDTKASISGFNEGESCGISSNLLDQFDLGKKELIVKTKVGGVFGEFARGIYRDIKDKVFNIGGKFTTNIFALADLGNGMELVRIELSGAALGPWIEYVDGLESADAIYDQVVTISKGKLCGRKGGKNYDVTKAEYNKVLAAQKKNPMAPKPVWFYVSAFKGEGISEELTALAEEKDKVLQTYLKGFDQAEPEVAVEELEVVEAEAVNGQEKAELEPDDIPF